MIDPIREARKSPRYKYYLLIAKIKIRWEILMYKLFKYKSNDV